MDPTACQSQAADEAMADPFTVPPAMPQLALLDFFFPGFSVFSSAFQKYLGIDLNLYIPLVLLCGVMIFAWRYFSEYFWGVIETHLMSTVEIRTDDEIYNVIMSWVAAQRFAQGARRFVVNTNLNSRSWFVWRWDAEDEDGGDNGEGEGEPSTGLEKKKKPLSYTPSFGSHTFWYRGRLLLFKRSQNQQQAPFLVISEREEISISCFGRNPWILKELLLEARLQHLKRDEAKTLIYRGTGRPEGGGPTWQRCMSRTSRPFSTVILSEKVKKDLIDDVTDYLNPATRRWYANRGIPYRRGYLLYGPPGTGKSSLSLALAGFFKMRIYIVSLSSGIANEENLSNLFAELPRRCVVLLEDIDTAGLTHTREDNNRPADTGASDMAPGQLTPGSPQQQNGRLSLSGLLNILDGVASQEGRVLIMTTNHIEKLDKALIRPGRVDMIVKFDRADNEMCEAIFRAIFATLEGDEAPPATRAERQRTPEEEQAEKAVAEEAARKQAVEDARISELARQFAAKIPAHEFSPAEVQGFLLKHKRDPDAVVAGAETWVAETRKEKKEKELKEAEEKRQAEQKAKEEEEKKKKKGKDDDEEKKKKDDDEKRKRKRKGKKSKKDEISDLSDSETSASEAESDDKAKRQAEKDGKVNMEPAQSKDKNEGRTTELTVPTDKKDGADSGYGTP